MRDPRIMARLLRAIGRERAVEIARDAAIGAGYSWKEPIRIRRWFGHYEVWSNWKSRGGAVRVTVAARTGDVRGVWAAPL
jgi:hypothetical protein